MDGNKNRWKNRFKYIVIIYGILSIVGIAVVLVFNRTPSTSVSKKTDTQPIFTTEPNPTPQMVATSLQKLSREIVTWKLSENTAGKYTIKAFKIYYAATSPDSKPDTVRFEWKKVHYDLSSADQYAKTKQFTLMQSSWQSIGQELAVIQKSK